MSLIRVFRIPPDDFAKGYLFGKSHPTTFEQVDWFRDDDNPDGVGRLSAATEPLYRDFLSKKRYASGQSLLVLGPNHSFTIGYDAP